ncbi:MAG: pilin [Pseudomonadales bacterium]|nr:pilin [Pseudomonadales bacterium]
MSNAKYNVILLAGVQEGHDFDVVVKQLAKLVKTTEEKIALLLRCDSTIIKKSITGDIALKYQKAISACGANCKVNEDALVAIAVNEDEVADEKGGLRSQGIDAVEKPNVDESDSAKHRATAADIYAEIDPGEDKDFVPQNQKINISESSASEARSQCLKKIFVGSVFILLTVWLVVSLGWPGVQQYRAKERLADDFDFIDQVCAQVTAYIHQSGTWPESNAQMGLSETLNSESVEAIQLGQNSILTVLFKEEIVGKNRVLHYVPKSYDHEVMWRCEGGNLNNELRPLGCRLELQHDTPIVLQFKPLVSGEGRARMVVPIHWTSLVQLSEKTLLQAASLEEENYVMVAVQDKSLERNMSVIAYGEKVVEKVFTNISRPKIISGPSQLRVDGKNATRYWVEGVIDGVEITYVISIIEGEYQFYQIFAWTLTTQLEENKAILETVSDSFYEADEIL